LRREGDRPLRVHDYSTAIRFRILAGRSTTMSQEDDLRKQLYDSFKNRAVLYYLIFDELRDEIGAEKAEQIMSRAIYRRGQQNGRKYARFGPADLAGLKQAFLGGIADDGHMFAPEVVTDRPDQLDIKFHRCPLREAWTEIGLSDTEVATLCRIAARIDNGTFDAAGFTFTADTWKPGGEGCCYLHLRPGKKP
jgi:hypothetical protein